MLLGLPQSSESHLRLRQIGKCRGYYRWIRNSRGFCIDECLAEELERLHVAATNVGFDAKVIQWANIVLDGRMVLCAKR